MFLSEDAFDLDGDGAGPHARREDARPAPGLHAGRRAPSRPGSSRAGSRPGSRGGAGSLSRPGSSHSGASSRDERDPLAPRGGIGGTGFLSGSVSGGRPATGFGASRHEAPAEFGAGGDDFGSDGHDGPGGPAASALAKARKARELAARRRRERQMGGGVVRNAEFAEFAESSANSDAFKANENELRGFARRTASTAPAPPSRPMAPGGFQRPRPPAQPRPTSEVRANPLFAGTAKSVSVSGYGRVSASPPHDERASGYGHTNGVRAFAAEEASPEAHPERRHRDDAVAPFDESGIETVTLESPGSPPRGHRGADARPGPTHVATGRPRPRRSPAVVEISDRRVFLTQPAPAAGDPVQCHILRRRGKGGVLGLGAKRYPEYFLYLDGPGTTPGSPTDGATFLLSARRRKKSTSSNYVISLDEEDLNRHGGAFFGKLRSNFVGTEFTVFDKGAKPGAIELSDDPAHAAPAYVAPGGKQRPAGTLPPRTELGAVRYATNVLGTKGPRVMTGAIPRVDAHSGARAIFRSDKAGKGGILEALKKKPTPDVEDLIVLKNKQPRWNEQMQAYCLNFDGRVTEASVKNFQLADSRDETETTLLQFGKVGKDAFTMDYAYPMSALQAFAICLSSFDNKLACE